MSLVLFDCYCQNVLSRADFVAQKWHKSLGNREGIFMADKWVRIARGIRYREHPTRRHGNGPDKYFVLRFTVSGKKHQEPLGWASEGVTLDKARIELAKLHEAQRSGEGPTSLHEKRQLAIAKRTAEELRQQQEAKASVSLSTYYESTYKPWAMATKAKAFKREDSLWRTWISPVLGPRPIRDIKLEQWDYLVRDMTKAGMSERTREYATGTLRRIMNHAIERQVVSTTPPSGRGIGSTAPKNNRRIRVLEPHELDSLLAELKMKSIWTWRIALFAALTGCRLGELAALTWRDVRLGEMTVTFPKTKNGTARTIPIEAGLVRMLNGMPPGRPSEYVFVNQQGLPYTDTPAIFRSTVEGLGLNEGRSKLDRFTFHSLRHGAATALAQKLTLRDLMDFMGWKVAAMALRYTHSNEASQRSALIDLERLVLGERECCD
jgi:integrase